MTIGRTHQLPEPFLVMATQNPIEQEGTYPLPEAQVDRFMLKVLIDYPSRRGVGDRGADGRRLKTSPGVSGREESSRFSVARTPFASTQRS